MGLDDEEFVVLNLYFEPDADNYRKNESDPLARQQTEDSPQCTAADWQDREWLSLSTQTPLSAHATDPQLNSTSSGPLPSLGGFQQALWEM